MRFITEFVKIFSCSMQFLNENSGAVTAIATIVLVAITAWYAITTKGLLLETRASRLSAGEPRVVAYLRIHEVHSMIVQLCVANLSGAAAMQVTGTITKLTEWPDRFDLQDSKILRDLSFLRPNEVIKLDLGVGTDLLREKEAAQFSIEISYKGLDGRTFRFVEVLHVESVTGHGTWCVMGMDDVARRLDEISKTLAGFGRNNRLKVDSFNAEDRDKERISREDLIQQQRNRQSGQKMTPPKSTGLRRLLKEIIDRL